MYSTVIINANVQQQQISLGANVASGVIQVFALFSTNLVTNDLFLTKYFS